MATPLSTGRGLTITFGRIEIDVPRSLGYFGAVGVAVAFGVIEPPLGVFIAAVPFVKMLGKADLIQPVRFAAAVIDGAAQPVGGEAEGTVRLRDPEQEAAEDVATAQSARRGRQIESAPARPPRSPATAAAAAA
jgi:hypothetical protein